jgi:hypothetical protein
MKYNNGDIDDLFRRASEKYPLRTDSADWDRLTSDLDNESLPPSDEDKRRRRVVFWWFLLIPLAGIGYMTWKVSGKQASPAIVVAQPHKAAAKGVGGDAGNAGTAGGQRAAGTGADRATGGTGGDRATAGTGADRATTVAGADRTTAGTGTGRAAAGTGTDRVTGGTGGDRETAGTGAGLTSAAAGGGRESAGTGVAHGVSAAGRVAGSERNGGNGTVVFRGRLTAGPAAAGGAGMGNSGLSDTRGSSGTSGSSGSGGAEERLLMPAAIDLRPAPVAGGYEVVVDVRSPCAVEQGTASTANNNKANNNKKKPDGANASRRSSHGYVGVIGAPDFSTVKFQSMKGVGATFGLLLGYSFNDRWSVESGVYVDRKRYYTNAEYFSTKHVYLPPSSTLLNVDGTCYMWEIPVNVRYNFTTSQRMRWFGTAGLSTYLMSKENYNYQYESSWGTETSSWNIHRPSQNWFSIVNLSVGLEQRVGKIGNLRLEPYLRVPLSGIGTGSLPILSAGVNIGLTRQLW